MKNKLTDCLRKYVSYMKQEGLSENTINQYVSYINKISEIDTRIYRLSNEQIQSFILKSDSKEGQNCKINALKKYFKVNHPERNIKVFIRPKIDKKVIEILTPEEVWRIVNSIKHTKQKAIVTGIYLHGLRISEVLKLRYQDIDRNRGLLIIRNGKGSKDRLVPLHKEWLNYLAKYSIEKGHKKGYINPIFQPYSESSIRNTIKKHCKKVGVNKRVYPHLLRDCYASHLLQSGYDISIIQEVLGHEKIETTRKYIYISAVNISDVKLKIVA